MSQTPLNNAELILNPDGSVYHLNLLPADIGEIVFFVGDPNRVPTVSKYFDNIEVQKAKREFVTHTGTLNGRRLTVISTGIGPDNIDIVWNELDALVNIDLNTRAVRSDLRSLKVIRLGTSGSLQLSAPTDSMVVSTQAIGLDGMMHFYRGHRSDLNLVNAFKSQVFSDADNFPVQPYSAPGDTELVSLFDDNFHKGITVTCNGFYGPQGRQLRLQPALEGFIDKLSAFEFNGSRLTNFEMETAAIYGLGNLLGHQCCSVNAIIANRVDGSFSADPYGLIDRMIESVLEIVTKNY